MNELEFNFVPEFGYSVTKPIIVYDDRDYEASYNWLKLDTGDEVPMYHLAITNLTPSSLKRMVRDWREWRPTFPNHLFTMAEVESPSWRRWVQYMGFVPVLDVPCTDDVTRTLFVSFSDNPADK